jgi:hypothetical protein
MGVPVWCKCEREVGDNPECKAHIAINDASKRIARLMRENTLMRKTLNMIVAAADKGDNTTAELECYHLAADCLEDLIIDDQV